MAKKILAVIAIAVAVVVGVWLYFTLNGRGELRLPGIVEIQEVRLGSKVGGRVSKILVEEGQLVEPGRPLVIFEVPELETMRDQLKARLAQAEAEYERARYGAREEEKRAAKGATDAAKARYDRMLVGWREEEKRQAASDLEAALADLKQASEDLSRVADLYRARSVSRAEYDAALSTRDRTQGRVNSVRARNDMLQRGNRAEDIAETLAEYEKAKAKLDELNKGTRKEDLDLAEARVAEAHAKLAEVMVNLKEAVVAVPMNLGKVSVEVLAVRPGDIVPANQPVVRVLRAEDMWVKVFVPETQIGRVRENMKVEITVDSDPSKILAGKIQQRANISEFTPRNVQSVDERRFQMFAVKVKVEEPGFFHAGMAAQVRIPLE